MNHIDNTMTQTEQTVGELAKAQANSTRPNRITNVALAITLSLVSPHAFADEAWCNSSTCSPTLRYLHGMYNVLAPASINGDNTSPSNNKVTINGIPDSAMYLFALGAFRADDTDVSGNQVHINHNSHYEVYVIGAQSAKGNASNNTVTITGGKFGFVRGGQTNAASKKAIGNKVIISGGWFGGSVEGGASINGGDAINNTVTIKKGSGGNPTFGTDAMLFGGRAKRAISTTDVKTGNTLNMHTTGITVRNMANFENLNFYVQKDTPANATFLTLTGTEDTDIRGTTIGIGIEGNDTLLKKGDKVVLIHKSGATGQLLTDAALNNNVTGMKGIAVLYDFKLVKQGDKTLIATLSDVPPPTPGATPKPKPVVRINPQVKSLSEARLAAVNFVNRGADLAAGAGLENLLKTTQNGGIQGFAALGSGKTRTKTGSHINVKGMNLILGAGTQLPNASGTLTVGGFVEGGKGSYDSYNDFVDRPEVRANGKTHYYGVGLLAKQQFSSDWFVDGGVRLGKSKMDYYSADLVDGAGKHTRFSSKASYWGASVGVGKSIALNEANTLTPYAKLAYTHYDSDRQKIAGDTFDFSDSHSLRSRLGVRWTHQLNETSELYTDAAWEHEFKGAAKGKVLGFDMPEPSLKGNTGIIDVGMNFTPNENLNIGVGVQGEFGKRRGVSATVKLKYSF